MNLNRIFSLLIILGIIIFILILVSVFVATMIVVFGIIDSIGEKKYHCENGKCVDGYDKEKTIYDSNNCNNQC